MMICYWCGRPVAWRAGEWVHADTGTVYVQRCDACGWSGGGVVCPDCGRPVRDDHCVMPVTGGEMARAMAGMDGEIGGWLEIKTIKGYRYAYRRWRDGRHKRSRYLGKV